MLLPHLGKRCRAHKSMRRVMGAVLSTLVGGARPVRHATAPAAARYFVVGGVHGCLDELQDLLKQGAVRRRGDAACIVGDLVNKGPKSLEVIRYCRENEIWAVRGNHDDKCLRLFDGVDELKDEYSYVRDMTAEDAAWLRNLPHTLTLPHVDSIVVHAGLRPSTKLEDQSPQHMTTMRSLEGGAPSAKPGDASWASRTRGGAAGDLRPRRAARFTKVSLRHRAGHGLLLWW